MRGTDQTLLLPHPSRARLWCLTRGLFWTDSPPHLPYQDTIVVHDPAYLDTLEASTGKGLPSFDVTRFQEYHKHASHHPSPLRPIQVGGGGGALV